MNRPIKSARLHAAGLYRTVGNDGFRHCQTLVVTIQTLIEDRCDRTALIAANFLGSFDTAPFFSASSTCAISFPLKLMVERLQVKHTLDGNGKTEYQQRSTGAIHSTAFEELLHQHLVHRLSFGN